MVRFYLTSSAGMDFNISIGIENLMDIILDSEVLDMVSLGQVI